MYISVLVSFCWPVFRLFRIFDLFLLFFNDFDLFPYRFLDIYFKKSSEFNVVQTKPNQHIMADDFDTSELVTLAPGFARGSGTRKLTFLRVFAFNWRGTN